MNLDIVLNAILELSPDNTGVKAADIAKHLSIEKKTVNSLLYKAQNKYVVMDEYYYWCIKTDTDKAKLSHKLKQEKSVANEIFATENQKEESMSTQEHPFREMIAEKIANLRPKLMDVSRRNPLINHSASKTSTSSIRIVDEQPQQIVEHLCVLNKSMKLGALPALEEDPVDENVTEFQSAFQAKLRTDPIYLQSLTTIDHARDEDAFEKNAKLERELKDRLRIEMGMTPRVVKADKTKLSEHARNHGINPSFNLPTPNVDTADERHLDDTLQTLLLGKSLSAVAGKIESKDKFYKEEKGLETLYLALGYVVWKEPNSVESKGNFNSPLLLLPVCLDKSKQKDGYVYSISLRDDMLVNPALSHKLENDFGITLNSLPDTDDLLDVEIWLQETVDKLPKALQANLRRQATLSIFPFTGIELFYDLEPDIDFSQFNLLSEMMSGVTPDGNKPFKSELSDHDVEGSLASKLVPHMVMNADSSQFLAMMKVSEGQSLAIEGPPGSGKSQTITNLIANAIYTGKKVLFVAQKNTALEVVLSRLQKLGLDKLVLPVTNEHTKNTEFYDKLELRIESRSKGWDNKIQHDQKRQNEQHKDTLDKYSQVLSQIVPDTQLSVHEALGLHIKHAGELDEFANVSSNLGLSVNHQAIKMVLDKSFMRELARNIAHIDEQLQNVPAYPESLFSQVTQTSLGFYELNEIKQLIVDVGTTFQAAFSSCDFVEDGLLGKREIDVNQEKNKALDELLSTIETVISYCESAQSPLLMPLTSSQNNLVALLEALPAQVTVISEFNLLLKRLTESQNISNEDALTFQKLSPLYNNNHHGPITALKTLLDKLGECAPDVDTLTEIPEQAASYQKLTKQIIDIKQTVAEDTQREESATFDIQALYDLSLIIQATPILKNTELLRVLSVKPISTIKSSLFTLENQAKVLLSEGIELEHLPSKKEIEELRNCIQTSGLFSFLSTPYKNAVKRFETLYNLPDGGFKAIGKLGACQKLTQLIDIYTKWSLEDANAVIETPEKLNLNLLKESIAQVELLEKKLKKAGLLLSDINQDTVSQITTFVDDEVLFSVFKNLDKSALDTLEENYALLEVALAELNELLNNPTKSTWEALFFEQFGSVSSLKSIVSSYSADRECYLAFSALMDLVATNIDVERSGVSLSDIEQLMQLANALAKVKPWLLNLSLSDASQVSWDNALPINSESSQYLTVNDICDYARKMEALEDSVKQLITLYARVDGAFQEQAHSIFDIKNICTATIADEHGVTHLVERTSIYQQFVDLGVPLDVVSHYSSLDTSLGLAQSVSLAVLRSVVDQVFKEHGNILAQSSGNRLTAAQKAYQHADANIIDLSASAVLDKGLEPIENISQGLGIGRKSSFTDLSLIRHQLGLKRKMPATKLIKRSQSALLDLHPCWLMVPSSIASYLPRKEIFDLLIIDEASQMTPEQSISALMRAKQAVIVGDTNQLPPTSFFAGVYDDEDEDEDVATVEESILELANNAFSPKHRLRWHYRSRHESLIAFSNHYVYDNELIIFPTPHSGKSDLGVSLVRADGIYERGLNPTEANKVVDGILHFMKTTPDKSLGVVTMNKSQQEHIEALILQARDADNDISDYLAKWEEIDKGMSRFFVKNIENVQGDERDVIFISTVYGKNSQGKFSKNFGPINGVAGKRRLNVLFSRAKERIVTYTSIPMADFDTSGAKEGVLLFKRWLEYSATGRLGEQVLHSDDVVAETDSPFEDAVIDVIKNLGFIPVPQVGVAGYFIDIGIKHPDYPLGYICGVECDGASYHSSKSARDRDILREEVLSRLNWSLYRIWSTDWFNYKANQIELLKAQLEERLQACIKEYDATGHQAKDEIPMQNDIEQAELENQYSSHNNDTLYIEIGSKFSVEYLSGSIQGQVANFRLVKSSTDVSSKANNIQLIGIDSPLGSAVVDGQVNDEVSYFANNIEMKVKIVSVEN